MAVNFLDPKKANITIDGEKLLDIEDVSVNIAPPEQEGKLILDGKVVKKEENNFLKDSVSFEQVWDGEKWVRAKKTHTNHPFDYKWVDGQRILIRNLNWMRGLTIDCPLERGERPVRHGYHWRTHLQQIEFWFDPKVFDKPAFIVDWESILKLGDNLHGFLGHMETVLWRRAIIQDMDKNKAGDLQ